MAEGTLDHFLKLSRKIVDAESPQKIIPYSKPRAKTKSPHHSSISSLNFDELTEKRPVMKIPRRVSHTSLGSKRADKEKERDLSRKPADPASTLPTWQASVMKSFKRLHRQSSSITDATTMDKNSSMYPSLMTFEDSEKQMAGKPNPLASRDENERTFVKSQTDFFNVNPNCGVARYINDCFKDTGLNFLKKRVSRKTGMNLTQRLGDLKSTTQPEFTKNHGTMLSCELWGNKRRIECRQQIKHLNNLTRAIEQSNRERFSSLHNTSIEMDAALCFDEDLDSDASTKPTLNFIKSSSHLRGKSLSELKQFKATPMHLPNRGNDGCASSTSLSTQKRMSGRSKIGSVVLRPQQSELQMIDQNNASLKSLFLKKKACRIVKQ